jgi:nucleoside-diphosphate-sugar epimerase
MRLKDKVAIVTGAASGIGQATALMFAAEGARVVTADIEGTRGKETVGFIEAYGPGPGAVRHPGELCLSRDDSDPGLFKAEQGAKTLLKRLGRPEEVALFSFLPRMKPHTLQAHL